MNRNLIRPDSVQLFIERVRNAQPSFVATDSSLPVIARICRRLDGMPLAIELTAATINFLSLPQIEAHWEQGLKLCREKNDQWQITWGLEGLGDVEKLEGHFAQLATAQEQYKRAAPIANTRAQLGEMAFTTAWTEGQKMTREQAVEYALRTASH